MSNPRNKLHRCCPFCFKSMRTSCRHYTHVYALLNGAWVGIPYSAALGVALIEWLRVSILHRKLLVIPKKAGGGVERVVSVCHFSALWKWKSCGEDNCLVYCRGLGVTKPKRETIVGDGRRGLATRGLNCLGSPRDLPESSQPDIRSAAARPRWA